MIKRTINGGSTNHFLDSVLDLDFVVTDPDNYYTFQGLLESTSVNAATSELTASVLLRRYQNGIPWETIIISTATRAEPEFPYSFNLAGTLTPGDWTMRLKIDGGVPPNAASPASDSAAYSWNAEMPITPEPSTSALLALGIVAVGRCRR